jgi:hypothetical protein
VPAWLYSRGKKEVIATGRIVDANYGQITPLLRSFAHRGYSGISYKTFPIDTSFEDHSELDRRKTHVIVIIKGLKRLRKPINLGQLEKNGLTNPNTGPGGRFVPITIFNKLDQRAR